MAERESVLNRFQVFITGLALELQTHDVKIFKSLITDKLPKNELDRIDYKEERYPAIDLFAVLQEHCLISENNLDLLVETFTVAGRVDLAERVKDFQKTVKESQMNRLPASNSIFLRLLLREPKRPETLTQRTNGLKESICKKLGLEPKDVAFISREDTGHQDCIFLVFQFPNNETMIKQLNFDALNKESWLVNLGVLQLQTGDKASINMAEDIRDIKPIPRRQTRILAMNPKFENHQKDALDLILGMELPVCANDGVIQQLLQQCQSSINSISKDSFENKRFDLRLGLVNYSNHSESLKSPAFVLHGLSKDFDLMKHKGQCNGGDDCSGMADALKRVVELTETDVRNEATKVCIFFTFLNQKSHDPEHYRCSHGNDVIELCYILAKRGITLCIIGINTTRSQSMEENDFLSGVATLGGGLYLEIDDLSTLAQIMTGVIRNDVSIDEQGQDTCKVLIDEINRKYGIVNINQLARHLRKIQLGVDSLRQIGKPPMPISQISERVAVSDNLEEAIHAIKTMKKGLKDKSDDDVRSFGVRNHQKKRTREAFGVSLMNEDKESSSKNSKSKKDARVDKLQDNDGKVVNLEEDELVDLAARMVRRHIYKLEYHKINEEQGN